MALDKVFACIWSIAINGQTLEIDRKRCITNIDIQTSCDGSDVATIDIEDKNSEYINDNIYIEEATIKITFMFVGSTEKIEFEGYISAIDIDFPNDGIPTMRLTCLDKSHVMNRQKKKRTWEKKTRMDVAKLIAQEYGFKFEGEPTYSAKVEDNVSQTNQTDIAFLEGLAQQEKPELFMCKLVGDTLYYKKKGLIGNPVATVHYKEYPYDVVSFNPQINKESMLVDSSVADIATDTKKTDSATVSTSSTTGQGEKVRS